MIDFSPDQDSEIRGTVLGRVVLALLKAVSQGNLIEAMDKLVPLLIKLMQQPDATGIIKTLLHYLYYTEEKPAILKMKELLAQKITPNVEEKMVSYAEELLEEGMNKGMIKGREEGREEGMIKGMIKGKMDEIAKLERLKEGGLITKDQFEIHVTPTRKELEDLQTKLAAFHSESSNKLR